MTYEEKKIKIIEKIQDSEYTPTTEQLEELFNLGFGQGIKVGLLHFRDKILKEFSGIDKSKIYKKGDKIAQLVFSQFNKPRLFIKNNLDSSTRSSGGFGSTGL